ncbi:MAG: NADH-quinone oxidoreductase subunit C [Lentisphaerota bacterium]
MMIEEQPLIQLDKAALLPKVAELFAQKYRLVQISCTMTPEAFELTYSFDLQQKLLNLRLLQPKPDLELPSITSIYSCAFTYENELHDLFGLNVRDIGVDFKGNFYRMAVKTPFNTGA